MSVDPAVRDEMILDLVEDVQARFVSTGDVLVAPHPTGTGYREILRVAEIEVLDHGTRRRLSDGTWSVLVRSEQTLARTVREHVPSSRRQWIRGEVTDSGGGVVNILVGRESAEYPPEHMMVVVLWES